MYEMAIKMPDTDIRYGNQSKSYILKQKFGKHIPPITISGIFISTLIAADLKL